MNCKEDIFGLLMINFTIEVLRQDFFQWRKHDMSNWFNEKDSKKKVNLEPLISAYKDAGPFNNLIKDIKGIHLYPHSFRYLHKVSVTM